MKCINKTEEMKLMCKFILFLLLLFIAPALIAQNKNPWHGIERTVHYKPDGEDFLLVNGKRRFNRALYGGNTAFRVEAGDLPEFALYLSGMGGNLKFGLLRGANSKWSIDAKKIETRYRPGSMLYQIEDSILGRGSIRITVMALFATEGLVIKMEGENIPDDLVLIAAFGGATGKKFSRDGDIGADPESSFDLKPEYCSDNRYQIHQNKFSLYFGATKPLSEEERYEVQHLPSQKRNDSAKQNLKLLSGIFPQGAQLKLGDATEQQSPLRFFNSKVATAPALSVQCHFKNQPLYFLIKNGAIEKADENPAALFDSAEATRRELASRIKVQTPDPYINTLGGALSIAADAIWEEPSYLHGAVAWRMRLNGWRGAYAADVLGWHDRARKHFDSYARSQVITPASGPVVMDTALHLARALEKMGTSLFSSGYISRNPNGDLRPHHYDMNLVFIDQLLDHFYWTGDTAYIRKMWPLLVRHLDWEKRNFDKDGDGLYDAYAAIWASDALQYSGGGVTHTSAYNYRANKTMAQLARLIGEDGRLYQQEAEKIFHAMMDKLWLKDKGWFAEYKDLLGNQLLHEAPGVWTIYHSIDAHVPDAFQSWQLLKYIDEEIPHIPIKAKGLKDTSLYTISTTNWQPYTWSLNNVALAELLNTSLAYWQGGRSEEAFQLWKSSLVESMYLGASPGNFQQLSFYDAMRGELYRDFADGIGVAARSLIEGLFGIEPNLLQNKLVIKPGFPQQWKNASLHTPDIDYSFTRSGNKDFYQFTTRFHKPAQLLLEIKAPTDGVASVLVNGKKVSAQFDSSAIAVPLLQVQTPSSNRFVIEIKWKGSSLEKFSVNKEYSQGETISLKLNHAVFLKNFDPQNATNKEVVTAHNLNAIVTATEGVKTFFVQVKQGAVVYWLPVSFKIKKSVIGTDVVKENASAQYAKLDLSGYFNDEVNNIFKHQYLSPRSVSSTLQLPTQGIGNWAYPLTTVTINDSGLRKRAGVQNEITVQPDIPFSTPSQKGAKNIVFTSQWDNFPKKISIPLNGKSSQAYFLMAGTTNPMQSRMANGAIIIHYRDETADTLLLKNPENWYPIEQDYYEDGYAFTTGAARPLRISLKTGEESRNFTKFVSIKGFSNFGIDGGAATVLSMPLNRNKELKSLELKAIANDVIIGLMSVTLVR